MKRFIIPLVVILLLCIAGGVYVGTLRPFAPDEQAPASPSMVAGVALTATATRVPSASETAPAEPVGVELPTETETLTPSPEQTSTSTSTATRTSTPTATQTWTPYPTFPLVLSDANLTQTAVPAIKTLDAIATRAIATWTPTSGPTPTPRAIDLTTNFLLMGTDLRIGDPTWVPSTDVMMVLFLDQANHRAALLSLPRDLVVAIPHHDAFRINYVYQYGLIKQGPAGGAALVKQMLHDEFDIRIDHWAAIDFSGFQKIIDTLGGIDINVPCPLEDTIDEQHFVIPAGNVHMDYLTAKRYVQSRYTTSDISRNYRQQRVLWAIAKKGLQLNALDKLQPLWDQLHSSVQTDLSLFDMAGLAPTAYQLDLANHPERIHAQVLEYPAVYPFVDPAGAWLFMPNYQEINNRLNHLFDAPQIAAGTPDVAECPGR
ncbi:MAG: LCP family protein [Anaerolineae bacterium]